MGAKSISPACENCLPPNSSIERNGAAESRLAAFVFPRKRAKRDPPIVQPLEADVPAEIFDMHAVVRELGIVRQLIGFFRKQFIDPFLAELGFALPAHARPMLQPAFP